MIRFIICVLSLGSLTQAFAQVETYLHNRTVLERMGSLGTASNVPVGSLSGRPPGTVGDVYLYGDYRNAGFILYDIEKVLSGLPARLDLQRNEFDLLTPGGVKALDGNRVRSMLWRDSTTNTPQYFVNAREFKNEEGVPYLGFFQVLSEGEISLFKKSVVIFKPAEEVRTHSVGKSDNKFIKKSKLYYTMNNMALEVPGKKELIKLFEAKQSEVAKFIKANEINFKNENHLRALFDYYNSLVRK